ncbi:glycerophosphodiester phosphodiesterase family protein [Salicola sp. Rm-C-2C1-2]|uniref:glycerophosphodiester phosphodiesterase family protein n=1 Tax=Salicola sp. Rm-C-2C1-2 TaxID=3141321 RepID=UPI0032E52F30
MKHRLLTLLVLMASTTLVACLDEGSTSNSDQDNKKGNDVSVAGIPEFANIAHRGASGHAPEATAPAFGLAQSIGEVDYLELDVNLSKDGELVVIHDTTVDRTTDGSGKVKDLTLEEIKNLDAGSWFNDEYPEKASPYYKGLEILTLDEVIDRFGVNTKYYIETKSPQMYPDAFEQKLVDTVEKHGLVKRDNVVLQSFQPNSLKKMHKMNADIPLVQLVYYWPKKDEDGNRTRDEITDWVSGLPAPAEFEASDFEAISEYAVGLGTNHTYGDRKMFSPSFVQKVHNAGLLVHIYTINDKNTMNTLINDYEVDGIFTNFPDRLAQLQPID